MKFSSFHSKLHGSWQALLTLLAFEEQSADPAVHVDYNVDLVVTATLVLSDVQRKSCDCGIL